MKYYVYILQCADQSLYTGYTKDIERRIREHNESNLGARYTKGKKPVKLIYSEKFQTIGEAMRREIEIKSWPREKKLALANNE